MKHFISATNLLLCCFLTVYRSFGQWSALIIRDVTGVTSLNELCPYTDFCTSNATDKLEDKTKTPCCGYCSCADDCWERKTCCEDKQTIIAGRPLETCESVGINSYKKQNWGYYVIKSCPTEESSLARKCSGELNTALEDSIWVTDTRTKKIYGNKHCALCHRVVNYSPWHLATDCVEAMNGRNSPYEVVKGFINECSLTVEPPSTEDHTDNICLAPDITTCNVTGKWKIYDKSMETSCNSFQQIYIQRQVSHTVIYRNIFCFLCNSQYPFVSDVCLPYTGRTTSVRFMGLLDFNKIERKTEVGEKADRVCAIDEIQDPFQNRCLKLSCPLLQSPVHGQCVRLLSSTRFFGVSALLVFNPVLVHTNTAIKGFSFDFETVARILSRRVGPKFGRCKPCGEEIFAPPTNKTAVANGNLVPEYFLISLNFYTTKRCQESFIVEIINELLGKEIKLPIGQEYVTLMISAANEEKYDNFLTFDGHLHVTSANCPMYVFTDFQKLSSCPSVSLNFTDYSALMRSTDQMSKKRQINSLFKQPARKGNAAPNTGNDAPNTGNDAPNTDNDAPNTGNDAPNTGNDAPNTGNDATYKDNDAPNTKTAEEGNVAINTDNFKVQACFETYLSVLPKKNHGFSNGPKMEIILLAVVIISSKCVA